MKDDAVVITGTGLVCALGVDGGTAWEALIEGKCGIGPIEGFDADGFGCRVAGQVRGLAPESLGIGNRDARIMGLHSYMLLKASRDALASFGADEGSGFSREDAGFFAGMGMVDYRVEDLLPAVVKSLDGDGALDYSRFYGGGYKEIYPLWPLSMLNNVTFCQVTILLNLRGDNMVLSPHAEAGWQAVVEALHSVADGRSTAALAAGVSETVNPCSLARAHLAGVLNTSDSQAERPCSPFDRGRSGTVPGEGCGAVVLESLQSAARRGAVPLAKIGGYGFAFEREESKPNPTKGALARAMRQALESACLEPGQIDLVIAHGDGTPQGDADELWAIGEVFAGDLTNAAVYSSKSSLGHLLAASPVVDLVLAVRMIGTGLVPPVPHCPSTEHLLENRLVRGKALRRSINRILINCRTFEGQAASLVVERAGGQG